jgi:cell wall assembly regulator SMI1
MSMNITLARLERWLREHAPATQEALGPAATLDAVQDAGRQWGVRPLPDLQRLWLWHNGSRHGLLGGLALQPGHYLLTVDQAVGERRSRTEIDGDSRAWSPQWVPITSDTGGSHIVVDHQPGDSLGTVFVADPQNGPMRHRGWPSLPAMIESLCEALEQHTTLDGHRAGITPDGHLTWEFQPPQNG